MDKAEDARAPAPQDPTTIPITADATTTTTTVDGERPLGPAAHADPNSALEEPKLSLGDELGLAQPAPSLAPLVQNHSKVSRLDLT